ncbi:hypothetical protein PTTG_28173 [Puccinia triticina 1-1 BBBD Race 1]|uniref:Uncharacterized protein n=1 Tax=Puccinia triticina (isolate 1-1 / race 1 (BBBD)) TaxID=630390 RepID=A0A180GEM9_PUCT1|nr:hypothetical protein PTTG_28173 [Puccinia triticina 1-1 BBBD Race 1]
MLKLLDDRLQKLESLEKRLKRVLSSTSVPASASQRRLTCYYCHVEGHGTARCDALQKDKEDRLLDQKGQNYFLPSGALIPFDPSRPIRPIVTLFQTSSAAAILDHATYRTGCGALQMLRSPVVPASSLSQAHASDLTAKKSHEPMSLRVPSNLQHDPFHPIRESIVSESSPSEARLRDSVSLLRCTPSAQAVDSVLKKISHMIGPGLLVPKPARGNSSTAASVAIAQPTAKKMNDWISLRSIKIGTQEVKVSSGTLVEGSNPRVFSALHPPVGCLVSSSPTPISLRDEVKLSSPSPIPLRDEVKLASRSSSDSINQQPSFQSQIRLCNEKKLSNVSALLKSASAMREK